MKRFVAESIVGTTLAGTRRYRLLQLLRSGGVAHVYLAETDAQEKVAVKLLRPELETRRDVVARFEREALAACRIRHENVLHVFEPVQRAGMFAFFSAEHLVGVDLADVLASQGKLPAWRAVRTIVHAAAGLGAAHEAGVVHRDVKPENIFLVHLPDGREQVKVLDFGSASLASDPSPPFDKRITMTTEVVGTPGYAAPEQAEGEPVRPSADLYALGVVLYEALSGKPPFAATNWLELLSLHARVPIKIPSGLSPALSAVLARCLEKKPEDRFAGMAELADALRAVPEHKG
ncbi:MAG: serine/threonine protein kinase [Polyangiaceae bacterium]|nr:serine/threonine protein kinase [Polyangiaceae bacterium]